MESYTKDFKEAFGIKSEFIIKFETKKKVHIEFADGNIDERTVDYIRVVEGVISSLEFTEEIGKSYKTLSTSNCNIKSITILDN